MLTHADVCGGLQAELLAQKEQMLEREARVAGIPFVRVKQVN